MAGGGPGGDDGFGDDATGRARPVGGDDPDGPDELTFDAGSIDDAELERALGALAHWAGDDQVADAVSQRRRTSWLARQATDDLTLAAVLTGLSERGRAVTVGSVNGRRHQGNIWLVGGDVVGLATDRGRSWLALAAVAWVRTPSGSELATGPVPARRPGAPSPTGSESSTGDLAREMAELAHERTRVIIRCQHADQVLAGVLIAVGRDLVTLRDDGDGLVYVALASVAEVSLPESG